MVAEPTHLKNMRKSNWIISPIFGMKIRIDWNHHPVNNWRSNPDQPPQQKTWGETCHLLPSLRRCQRRFFQSPNLVRAAAVFFGFSEMKVWEMGWKKHTGNSHRDTVKYKSKMACGRFLRKIWLFQREIHYYTCAVNKNPFWISFYGLPLTNWDPYDGLSCMGSVIPFIH